MDIYRAFQRIVINLDHRIRILETREQPTLAWQSTIPGGLWTNVGPPYPLTSFWKDRGLVHLRGRITGGAIPGDVFTLPDGYRPEFTQVFSNVQISAAGVVRVLSGSSPVSLDGIVFRAFS